MKILATRPVPVIPMALQNLWGSFFSRVDGKAMTRPFRRGFYSSVRLMVGEPMAPGGRDASGCAGEGRGVAGPTAVGGASVPARGASGKRRGGRGHRARETIAGMRSEPARVHELRRTAAVQRGALVGTLAAIAYCAARFRTAEGFVRNVDRAVRLSFDFLHYYYASAEALLAGLNPVPGYLYSPVLAIFLMPWTLLGPEPAILLWTVLQALPLWFLILRCAALGPSTAAGGFLAALLVLLSTATLHSLKWGQVGLIVGVVVLESVIALARRRERAAALLLGSAIALKFYPAILWPLALALKRWRAAAGAIVVAFALLWIPSLLVLGSRRTLRFYSRIARAISDVSLVAVNDGNSQAVVAWLRRQFHVGSASEVAIVGAVLVLLTLILVRLGADESPSSFQGTEVERGILAGLSLNGLVPFFVVTCWPLYFCTLPALTLLTVERWRRRPSSKSRSLALGILGLSGLLQTFPAVDLAGGWDGYVDQGLLLEANLGVLLCAFVSLAPLRSSEESRGRGPSEPAPQRAEA